MQQNNYATFSKHGIIKKLQAGKPDSVVDYHLSVPKVTNRNQSAYPPSSDEQSSGDGICGISACKVYPDA